MAKSITDEEIGLIKAMLARGERNVDIQFRFNRQDRPANSGRISQIRNGTYGPEVLQASDEDLRPCSPLMIAWPRKKEAKDF